MRDVLAAINLGDPDIIDTVYALLDDTRPSWFSNAPGESRFSSGASTAHVGCHVGILQRGRGKLDREGRDYWLKPLWEIGAVEKVYFDSPNRRFVPGHPVPKSGNCAYRLAPGFVELLQAPEDQWRPMLSTWAGEDRQRERLILQAEQAARTSGEVSATHSTLIDQAIRVYVPRFLPGYEPIYIDDGDGERVSAADRERLEMAGLDLRLGDAMPDVILRNPTNGSIWILEAVTSDGEVDRHKVEQIRRLAGRTGKIVAGFTTVYPTWRVAAARQGKFKNIPGETHIWILEDPGRCFRVHEQPPAPAQ